MQRTVCCKITPTGEQAAALRAAMAEFALGQTIIAIAARDAKCANPKELHHLTYYGTRAATRLGANMVCNAGRRVAGAYRTLKRLGEATGKDPWPTITFSPRGAMRLDCRTFAIHGDEASLWTLTGRVRVPMVLGKRQRRLLKRGKVKTADVVCKRGRWYLHVAMQTAAPAARKGNGMLGVDVGENTLAATSEGKILGGEKLRHARDVWLARRRVLQANGSQSAMQRLRNTSGRENRHVRHVNHEASKQIVAEAMGQNREGIGMEDLTLIRDRIRAGRRMRGRLHRWAWRQLQTFVAYKAEEAGLRVVFVDPAYTSQTCADCQSLGTRRRHLFTCSCGSSRHADSNAARNIRRLAEAIAPATRPVRAGKVALLPATAA